MLIRKSSVGKISQTHCSKNEVKKSIFLLIQIITDIPKNAPDSWSLLGETFWYANAPSSSRNTLKKGTTNMFWFDKNFESNSFIILKLLSDEKLKVLTELLCLHQAFQKSPLYFQSYVVAKIGESGLVWKFNDFLRKVVF